MGVATLIYSITVYGCLCVGRWVRWWECVGVIAWVKVGVCVWQP